MIDFLITKMHDPRFMTMFLAAIAASATAYTLIMPLFAGEGLAKRMKAVASERERIRQRERDRLAKSEKVSLRQTPKQLVSKNVSVTSSAPPNSYPKPPILHYTLPQPLQTPRQIPDPRVTTTTSTYLQKRDP